MYQYNNKSRYIRQSKTRIESSRFLYTVIMAFLFLMAMNFNNRVFYCAVVVFALVLFVRFKKYDIPLAILSSLALMVSMLLFSSNTQGNITFFLQPVVYPMCVLTGYNIAEGESGKQTRRNILLIVLVLSAGAYGHYLLNMFSNLGKSIDRNTFDFWTKSALSATGQALMAFMMIGVAVSVFFTTEKNAYKMLAVAALISILYYNLILGGRTIIVLIVLLFAVNLFIIWGSTKDPWKLIRGMTVMLIIIALILLVLKNNLFGIMDTISKSNLYQRFFTKYGASELTEDGRMNHKLMYIKYMLDYPFGRNELGRLVGDYAHDIILDTYSMAGIFACGAVIVMLTDAIIQCVKILRDKEIDRKLKSMILNVMVSIFVAFASEPILFGAPWLFASFCVIYGSIKRLTESQQ